MNKFFNIAGPCIPGKHYMLPALERNPQIKGLIDKNQYFVIHAARQTGKTTLLKSLVKQLNDEGTYYALYCSLEAVQGINEPEIGIGEIINNLEKALYFEKINAKENFAKDVDPKKFTTAIYLSLAKFSEELGKPFVLLFDEADCLSNGTLITFLRQLRDGYVNRGNIPFVHSIALVGMRDIRDYKAKIREDNRTLGSASPFNIISKSLTIGNFTESEVYSLYHQHTEQTGQEFEMAAIKKAYYWTRGQPWLVNALVLECEEEILKNDYSQPITQKHIDQAAENIMLRRDTHIDSLLERLKEERVKKVVQPILLGKEIEVSVSDDDTQYCIDLGIIRKEKGQLLPSNPIYREVIIRTLSYDSQFYLEDKVSNPWIKSGNIDMNGLLKGFQQFWRENSDVWVEKYQYKEAAPHLILQAFLQRVINGGGHIDREYATGKRRMDLCVHFGNKKYPIEIKLWYSEKTRPEGIAQLSDYMDTLGEKEGWLVIFDRSEEKTWDEKIYWQEELSEKRVIRIVGC